MDESRGSEHYLRSIFPEITELYEFGIYIFFGPLCACIPYSCNRG